VISVGDGIAWIAGLPSASWDAVLSFEDGSRAMVFDLTETLVGAVKLDYLQFLDLEGFTRFGARLESSMEKAIRRGQALREIFGQDRLEPLPIEFQMAWLVAFNDGRFDAIEPEDIPARLKTLETRVGASGLTLDSPREQWATAVADWLAADHTA
jgi:F-type H+-transporting ATPase subunit alpha